MGHVKMIATFPNQTLAVSLISLQIKNAPHLSTLLEMYACLYKDYTGEISISATARKYFLNGFGSKHVRFGSKQYSFGSKHCFVYTFIFPYFFIFVHILRLYIVTFNKYTYPFISWAFLVLIYCKKKVFVKKKNVNKQQCFCLCV